MDAIYIEEDLPEDQHHFLAINAEYAAKWPVLDVKKDEPSDAHDWDEVKEKYPTHFDPEAGP